MAATDPRDSRDQDEVDAGRAAFRARVDRLGGDVFATLPTPLDLDDEEDW